MVTSCTGHLFKGVGSTAVEFRISGGLTSMASLKGVRLPLKEFGVPAG